NADYFLALNPSVLLLRQAGAALGDAAREPLAGPLKVLVAWANPRDGHWPDLAGAAEEANAVKRSLGRLGANRGAGEVQPEATAQRLPAKLRAFRPRVIHFIGHGAYPDRGADDPGDEPPDDPVPLPGPSLVLEGRHTAARRAHAYLPAGEFRALCRACEAR